MIRFFVVLGAALLSGMGVGSGGFYLLYLTEVAGLSQYTAQGANLVFFSVATLSSSLLSLRGGRLSLARLFPLLLYGALGTLIGAALTHLLPPESAARILGLLLTVSGVLSLRSLFARLWHERGKKNRSPTEIP